MDNHPKDLMLFKIAAASHKIKCRFDIFCDLRKAREYLTENGNQDGLHAGWSAPTVAMLDPHFPGDQAWEFLKWLKEDSAWSALPVVMCSGVTCNSLIERSYFAGADLFLSKMGSYRRVGEVLRCLEASLAKEPFELSDLRKLPEYRGCPVAP